MDRGGGGGDEEEDGRDSLPLHRQRYFGAGIKRKRVDFVRASSPSGDLAGTVTAGSTTTAKRSGDERADAYLSIVLGRSKSLPAAVTTARARAPTAAAATVIDVDAAPDTASHEMQLPDASSSSHRRTSTARPPSPHTSPPPAASLSLQAPSHGEQSHDEETYECVACAKRVKKPKAGELPHEASLSHQVVALQHSHPPSSIDRQSKGFSYMSSYGWDPDKRVGLGAEGAGRLYPVRAVDKQDTLGIGAEKIERIARQTVEKLDAGQVRKMEIQKAKRAKRLQQLLHGRDDVNKYLGIDS